MQGDFLPGLTPEPRNLFRGFLGFWKNSGVFYSGFFKNSGVGNPRRRRGQKIPGFSKNSGVENPPEDCVRLVCANRPTISNPGIFWKPWNILAAPSVRIMILSPGFFLYPGMKPWIKKRNGKPRIFLSTPEVFYPGCKTFTTTELLGNQSNHRPSINQSYIFRRFWQRLNFLSF